MKKIIAICLVFILAATVAACSKSAKGNKNGTTASGESTTYNYTGIVSEEVTVTLDDVETGEESGNSSSGSSSKEAANDSSTTSAQSSGKKETTTKKGSSSNTTEARDDITYNDDGSFDTPIIPIG